MATLTADDYAAATLAIWSHPQGIAYLAKIALMELLLPAWLAAHRIPFSHGGGTGGGSWPRPWKQQQAIEDTEALHLLGMI